MGHLDRARQAVAAKPTERLRPYDINDISAASLSDLQARLQAIYDGADPHSVDARAERWAICQEWHRRLSANRRSPRWLDLAPDGPRSRTDSTDSLESVSAVSVPTEDTLRDVRGVEPIARRYPLAQLRAIADSLVTELLPCCERIVVAGSIRRRKATVKDIELLAVPKVARVRTDLFGDVYAETDLLQLELELWLTEGRLRHRLGKDGKRAFGPKYKRVLYRHGDEWIPLDVFSTSADSWGLVLLERTGPAEYSKAMLAQRAAGGTILPFGYRCFGNVLHRGDTPVVVPDEQAFYAICDLPYIEPWERG